ncbi:MAG: hypothetical protein OXG37_11555 [Actinomycetia bacterium]|nr:hypothetical protein [Actinomycetes bacterium]
MASSVYGELAFSKNTAAREEAIRELSVPIEELRACGKTLMRDVGAPPAGSSMRVAYRAVRNACAEYERAGDALGRHFDAQREHVREFQRGRAVKRLYRGHDQMEAARLTLETAADQ